MAVSPLEGPIKVLFQVEHGGDIRTFEWDTEKNWSNFVKHGIRFEDAALVFMTKSVRGEDHYRGKELRHIAYGRVPVLKSEMKSVDEVDRVIACVVYTLRGGIIRLISARPAKAKEREHYERYIRETC